MGDGGHAVRLPLRLPIVLLLPVVVSHFITLPAFFLFHALSEPGVIIVVCNPVPGEQLLADLPTCSSVGALTTPGAMIICNIL